MVKKYAVTVAALVALALGSCATTDEAPTEPGSTPETSTSPSPTENAAPAVATPENCDGLLSGGIVQFALGDDAEPAVVTPSSENPVALEFAERDGLLCSWILPNSEAGLSLYVAERGTPSDANTTAQWQSQGLTEVTGLMLDAFWYQQQESMVGTSWEARALAGGHELRLEMTASDISALEGLAEDAAVNMNYR